MNHQSWSMLSYKFHNMNFHFFNDIAYTILQDSQPLTASAAETEFEVLKYDTVCIPFHLLFKYVDT
jgi:hypothetical protein